MTILDTGNVGIGTTTPTQKLDVLGTVKATSFIGDGSQLTGISGSGQWSEGTGGIYYNGGNVGIGTNTPQHNLEIYSDSSTNNAEIRAISNSSIRYGALTAYNASNDNYIQATVFGSSYGGSHLGTSDSNALMLAGYGGAIFKIGSLDVMDIALGISNTEIMRLKTNGNVGIGTTNPSGILDVVDASSGGSISTTSLGFKVNKNYDALVLEGASIVGMTLASGRSTQSLIGFADEDDATAGYVQYIHATDQLHLGSCSFTRVTVDGSGNVGIGTTSPSYKLDINGGIRCTSLTETSDVRLKEDIMQIDNPLEKVLTLRGVSFRWRTEEFYEKDLPEGRRIGLIAQEVEGTLPEVVSTDNEGYKSVEYGNIVSVLIEAIKAQQAQIEELKLRLDALER